MQRIFATLLIETLVANVKHFCARVAGAFRRTRINIQLMIVDLKIFWYTNVR